MAFFDFDAKIYVVWVGTTDKFLVLLFQWNSWRRQVRGKIFFAGKLFLFLLMSLPFFLPCIQINILFVFKKKKLNTQILVLRFSVFVVVAFLKFQFQIVRCYRKCQSSGWVIRKIKEREIRTVEICWHHQRLFST